MIKQLNTAKNGKLALYVALLVLVVLLMVGIKNCGSKITVKSPTPAKSGGDTLDVAIEYSPISYYTYADTLGGFNYDLLRLISKRMDRPMKFHPVVTLTKSLSELNEGTFDLLAAQIPVTTETQKDYLFTDVVYLDKQVLVQRKDAEGNVKVKSQLDLADKTVWIVKGSPMKERVEALAQEIGETIHIKADDQYGPEQLFLRVVAGEIDYAVINCRIAAEMAQKYEGKIDVMTAISFSQFQSWVLKKGNGKLQQELNKQLKAVRADSSYHQIAKKYL